MRFSLIVLFSYFLALNSFSQTNVFKISGVVRDANTQETLPFANVFLANTTYGTVTNEVGEFNLTIERPGTYDLIVKFVGFETYARSIQLLTPEDIGFEINLIPESVNLGSVEVVAKKDAEWKSRLEQFKRLFLGESANAKKCKILNEEAIDFIYDEQSNSLEAFSREPLIIENKALGYKLTYLLEEFVVYYRQSYTRFYGFPVFEPMEGGKRKQANWDEARLEALNGSVEHFFKALYHNELDEIGYEVQMAKDIKGFGRVTDGRPVDLFAMLEPGPTPISKKLNFEGYVYITYVNELESPEFMDWKNPFSSGKKSSVPKKYRKPQQSWISMVSEEEPIVFEQNGYVINPIAFYSNGYWGFEKIADIVPTNYEKK
ncbi:carboxypeptidase-like regulatory domain-containing protein [Roseivirga pacifica]